VTSQIQVVLQVFRNGVNRFFSVEQPFLDYRLIKVNANQRFVIWVFPKITFREIVDEF
jgi:hypothetical protein